MSSQRLLPPARPTFIDPWNFAIRFRYISGILFIVFCVIVASDAIVTSIIFNRYYVAIASIVADLILITLPIFVGLSRLTLNPTKIARGININASTMLAMPT